MSKQFMVKASIILSTVYLLVIVGSGYALNKDFAQKVEETEKLARIDLSNNHLFDALQKIIDLFRSVPENDVESADMLLGPLQLYNFIITEYCRPEALYVNKKLLEEYPTDKLLMAVACLVHPATRTNMIWPSGVWLNQVMSDTNTSIKYLGEMVSVYALTSQEGQKIIQQMYSSKSMKNTLSKMVNSMLIYFFFEQYPDSTASQLFLQDLLDRGVESIISQYGTCNPGKLVQIYIDSPDKLDLLKEFKNIGLSAQKITGFEKIQSVFPSMNYFDFNQQVIQKFADMLKEEKDINTRYALITLLKLGIPRDKECQEISKSALIEASHKKELTPDVIYAKMTLLKLAIENSWLKEAEEMIVDITQIDVLPPIHGVKGVYAQQKNLIKEGTEFFVKLGNYEVAKKLYEIQLDKYKGDMGIRSALVKLEKTPLDYSLYLIQIENCKGEYIKNPEAKRAYYNKIIQNTSNSDLRNYLSTLDGTKPIEYHIDQPDVIREAVKMSSQINENMK